VNLNEVVRKRIRYLTEGHMRQEGIVGDQMYLEIFALYFYVSDIVTFNTNSNLSVCTYIKSNRVGGKQK